MMYNNIGKSVRDNFDYVISQGAPRQADMELNECRDDAADNDK